MDPLIEAFIILGATAFFLVLAAFAFFFWLVAHLHDWPGGENHLNKYLDVCYLCSANNRLIVTSYDEELYLIRVKGVTRVMCEWCYRHTLRGKHSETS